MTIVSAPRLPGAEDLHRSDRRPERPARRRDAALHDHGEEHRQRRRRERRAARRCAGEHDLRRGQHDPERRGGRGFRRPVAARERHADQLAGRHDAGFDACRRVEQPGQRRHDHVRCGREPERRRRHGDLESGLRHGLDNGIVDHPSDDPDTPTANDPTRDIVGNLPLLYAEKRVTLVQSIWVRRASSIRATCCATRSPFRIRRRLPPPASS